MSTNVGTKPLTVEEACARMEAQVEKIVRLLRETTVSGQTYVTWVANVTADTATVLWPTNKHPIADVWPYRDDRACDYNDPQIRLAVQIAIVLQIGDVLGSNPLHVVPNNRRSLCYRLNDSQLKAQLLVEQLVAANVDDAIDP